MKYSNIAVIYNPNSTGSSEKLAREFEKQLRDRLPKQKIEIIETKHAGHGEELSYKIASASKNPLIISSSGDGGYNDVINGAMKAKSEGHKPTTGLLPAGNANDHYSNAHEESVIGQIVKGKSMKLDVLKITGVSGGKPTTRYAHSYIGFGLTPYVGEELNRNKINPFNEFMIVAKALLKVKPVRLKIRRKPRYYESVIFSNVRLMSKYLKISSSSSMTDGKFEVTIFKRRNKAQLMLILLKAMTRGIHETKRASIFRLRTIEPTLVQADGEILKLDARSEVVVSIEKRALNCIV